ncbi:MAG: ATP-dependent DNA helicase RecG [Burkholderiaceae bacterium]
MASPLERFAKLGIRDDVDLLLHLPLRYEDETRICPIAQALPGQIAQVQGEVVRREVVDRGRRSLLVEIRDASAALTLRFFHFYGSQLRQFEPGTLIRAIGEVRGGLFGRELLHPRYRVVHEDTAVPATLTPVYPTAQGIGQAALRGAIRAAWQRARLDETVPPALIADLGLPTLERALRQLHEPPADVSLAALQEREHPAWQRVIFDELLAQQLSLRLARAARAGQRAPVLDDARQVDALLARLPFTPTAAQARCWREIAGDLAGGQPMNRLLQGDVGSGKTVVAAMSAAMAVGSGWQAALMAPTEILAEQHFRKLEPWMSAIGIRIAWLSSSMKEAAKRTARQAVAAGDVDLLVGTHALIEDSVTFRQLGLAIVDEQHRFGVAQRLALRGKLVAGGQPLQPHQLMMSATPIPRTLAMTYYADLDVSIIDELPPGRQPIATRLVSAGRRDELIGRVREAARQGRQIYWVCPLIEESEALDLQTAHDTHAELSAALAPIEIGLAHGRLPAADKQAVMQRFADGEIRVLVATTVIEVGVDVPNASLMVVEHAERFGLAQLHQLRGRVGRGSAASVCVLLYHSPLSPLARERLKIMYETQDGFEIARRDLALRGPGELLGARQSGVAMLRFADLQRDDGLVERAREVADRMLAGDPAWVERHLARWIAGRDEFLKA